MTWGSMARPTAHLLTPCSLPQDLLGQTAPPRAWKVVEAPRGVGEV